MKQSEKLDIILRYLYERRDDRRQYNIADILLESKVTTNHTETNRLAFQLRDLKYIDLNQLSSSLMKANITSKGIAYCEEDSFSRKGQSVVNNYNIINSSNANIVVNSSQVEINQTTQDKAKKIINKIRDAVGNDQSVKLERNKATDVKDLIPAYVHVERVRIRREISAGMIHLAFLLTPFIHQLFY